MTMALLFKSTYDDSPAWRQYLREHIPDLEVRSWHDVGDPAAIEFALVWKPGEGYLGQYPNLRVIFSLGAGVDHIFADSLLPEGVPVVRIVDADLSAQLSEYAIHGVLHFHRRMPYYFECNARKEWGEPGRTDASQAIVAVLGLGNVGSDLAPKLRRLGFKVRGWSRTPKALTDIECYHGERELEAALRGANFLVCALPLTESTKEIINARTLAGLSQGAYVINIGRGDHVVDRDLLEALDQGRLAGAMLDVFRQEPLPPDHEFWTDRRIKITPHIAGDPSARTAARQVAENILRAQRGEPLQNVVNSMAGY
jgi:glyoxylate/hydroxypyruvate reductase A